jgi:transposase
MGRPSVDPELLIRMLIVGYCFGIRSERRLCEEVHLNLAYRVSLGGHGVSTPFVQCGH